MNRRAGHRLIQVMPHPIHALLRRLSPPDDPSSDAALLYRFVTHRDQTAFELLVWRHGGLVLGVCRRMLRDDHLAEDAFQATFLVLARRAGSVRGSLAGWLHQVARRVCLKARKTNPVPRQPGSERPAADSPDPLLSAELRAVLDEEIARLPEKQRLAVLLCYLQGRTTDDAAKYLNIPHGTVLSRLDAARKRLRSTLTRRGISVPVTLLAGSLIAPDLTAESCRTTTEAAVRFLAYSTLPTIPTQLAHEVMQMTARKTMLGVAAALVLTAGVGTGVGLVMAQGGKSPATKSADKPAAEQKAEAPREEQKRDAELQAKLREQRHEELQRYQLQISKQIEDREENRLRLFVNSGSDVDPKALQAKLDEIDQTILVKEETIAAYPKEIESMEKWIQNAKAGRFVGQENRMSQAINDGLTDSVEVRTATHLRATLSKQLQQLRPGPNEGSELYKEAEKKLAAAEEEIKKAVTTARPRVEKEVSERFLKEAEASVKHDREQLEQTKKSLSELRAKRLDWVRRIQQAKASLNAQQLIDDEIQVLREIRKQVLRERLILEMGLDERK